jgi:hypothetical protein
VSRLSRVPIIKDMARDAHIDEQSLPYGLLGYPVLQAADILLPKAHLVPADRDNVAHVEVAREIARRFNTLYGQVFPEPDALVSDVPALVDTDGQGKMSKSADNAIMLSDDAEAVTRKVMAMYTDPRRVRADIPGTVEGSPVFSYHDAFNSDRAEVEELERRYRAGRVGDVEVKTRLAVALNRYLAPIRDRMAHYEERAGLAEAILDGDIRRVRTIAQETMRRPVPGRPRERVPRLPGRQLRHVPRRLHALASRLLRREAQRGERSRQPGRDGRQPELEQRLGGGRGCPGRGRRPARAPGEELPLPAPARQRDAHVARRRRVPPDPGRQQQPLQSGQRDELAGLASARGAPGHLPFTRLMIGFRKAHPSLCRSRFWRDDIHWYGAGPAVDLSHRSRTLAYHLSGVSQGDDDLYVMVNAYWEPLEFVVQEGRPSEWQRVVDTARESPEDIREPDRGVPLTSARYPPSGCGRSWCSCGRGAHEFG